MNSKKTKKYVMVGCAVLFSGISYAKEISSDIEGEEPVGLSEMTTPVSAVKAQAKQPAIRLVGVNNQSSEELSIITGGERFTVPAKTVETFDILFPLTTAAPVLKIQNATTKTYKSSGPIRIRLSKGKDTAQPTKGDLFLISVPYYQQNDAYGTRWANARITVEEPSIADIGKRSPVILATWDNGGKNMPLSPDKHHDIKLNLTIVDKPTYEKDAQGNQAQTTYIDLESDALEVDVDEEE